MKFKSKEGGVLVEFMMVISIFVFIAFIGFELSSCLKQKRLAMSLSKEIANSIYKDCPDMIDRDAQKTCLKTTLEQFNAVSSIITEGTYFRVGIHWNFANVAGAGGLDSTSLFYVCKNSSLTCTEGPTVTIPGATFRTAPYNAASVVPPITIPLQVSVDLAIKYTPIITSIASVFGLQDGTFFYARTIL